MPIELPRLHPGQVEIAASRARFKVLCCGRRWGKSRLGCTLALHEAIKGHRASWVSADFQRASEGFELLWDLAARLPGAEKNESKRRITIGRGRIDVRSADDPEQLRGPGLDLVVIDEAAFCKPKTWTVLRPALADRKGKALFISTPAGFNWFYRLFQRGKDPLYPNWQSWQAPTSDNPFISPEEIADLASDMTAMEYDGEILALFTADAGKVFRDVRSRVYGPLGKYQPSGVTQTVMTYLGGRYRPVEEYVPSGGNIVAGCDLAQLHDYTVITIFDTSLNAVVDIDRFNMLSWAATRGRIEAICRKWRVSSLVVELNSIGSPNLEALRDDLPVHGFTTTNASKDKAIRAVVLAFETGRISIPDYAPLVGELEAFEMKRLPSGKWQYNAPAGQHDDCVISLALALHAARNESAVPAQQPFLR